MEIHQLSFRKNFYRILVVNRDIDQRINPFTTARQSASAAYK